MNWNYKREDQVPGEQFVGKRRCVIVDAQEAVSSSGNNMIVITVKPSGSNFKVKTWLVDNEKFNVNATKFFDTFPEITEGDFNLLSWIGAEGAANFSLNDDGFLRVRDWVIADKAEELPPFEGSKPERQVITQIEDPEDDEDEGDLPWV